MILGRTLVAFRRRDCLWLPYAQSLSVLTGVVTFLFTAAAHSTDLTCAVLNISHYDYAPRFFDKALKNQILDPIKGEPAQLELIIHRSNTGVDADTRYSERQKLAAKLGYLWGAFHYARPNEDPVAQADKFIDTVSGNIPDRTKPQRALLVFDLEYHLDNPKKFLGLEDGARFIERVKERTGLYPGIYVGHNYLKRDTEVGSSIVRIRDI